MPEQSIVVFDVCTLAVFPTGSNQWNGAAVLWNSDNVP